MRLRYILSVGYKGYLISAWLVVFLVCSDIVVGQIQVQNQVEYIEQAKSSLSNDLPSVALMQLSGFTPADSLYPSAIALIARAHYKKQAYAEAYRFSKLAVDLGLGTDPELLATYIPTLIELDKIPEGIKHLEKIINKYPFNFKAYQLLGLLHQDAENDSLAEVYFFTAMRLNVYYPDSYQNLANLLLKQGRIAEAILVSHFYFMFTTADEPSATELLQTINNACHEPPAKSVKYKPSSENFKLADEYIRSRAVLKPEFKNLSKLDNAFIRQTLAVFLYLSQETDKLNPYYQFFFPFIDEMMDKKYFDVFAHRSFISANNNETKSYFNKNRKKVQKYYKWANQFLLNKYSTFKFDGDTISYQLTHYKANLYKVNGYNPVLKRKIGPQYELYPDSRPKISFMANHEQQPVGYTYLYNPNGSLSLKQHFTNAYPEPQTVSYYTNGQIDTEIFKISEKDTLVNRYFSDGTFKSKYIKTADKRIYTVFNPATGVTHTETQNENRMVVEKYYLSDSGTKQHIKKISSENNILQTYYSYHSSNGAINQWCELQPNKLYAIKTFYPNGKIALTGKLNADLQPIDTITFFDTLGNFFGRTCYSLNGNLISEQMNYFGFNKAQYQIINLGIIHFMAYDTTGNLIFESETDSNAITKINIYEPMGGLLYKGEVLLNSTYSEWERYSSCGEPNMYVFYDENGLLSECEHMAQSDGCSSKLTIDRLPYYYSINYPIKGSMFGAQGYNYTIYSPTGLTQHSERLDPDLNFNYVFHNLTDRGIRLYLIFDGQTIKHILAFKKSESLPYFMASPPDSNLLSKIVIPDTFGNKLVVLPININNDTTIFYYPNQKQQLKNMNSKGALPDNYIAYYPNGNVAIRQTTGLGNIRTIHFYDSLGNIFYSGTADDAFLGNQITYYANKQPYEILEMGYVSKPKPRKRTLYFPNGEKALSIIYYDGVPNGFSVGTGKTKPLASADSLTVLTSADGQFNMQVYFSCGLPDGVFKITDKQGKVYAYMPYNGGTINGQALMGDGATPFEIECGWPLTLKNLPLYPNYFYLGTNWVDLLNFEFNPFGHGLTNFELKY